MENFEHNFDVLASLKPGDMIKFRRGIYSHWGIYYGDSMVIHFTESKGGKRNGAKVRKEDFWIACKDKKAYKSNTKDNRFVPGSVEEILDRADSLLNKTLDYNFITCNCEHFASWCRYGKTYSEQATNFVFSLTHVASSAAGGAVGGAVIGGPLGAAAGAVIGAAGATAIGIIRGTVAHFRSQ